MEAWTADKKRFNLVLWCHQLQSGFLTKGNLHRVSRQSRMSTNDNGDLEMIPGLCTDLLEIPLHLRKTSVNVT
jgi:hypothetical protein